MVKPAAGGLFRADVASRVERGLSNPAPDTTSRNLWETIRANVLTLFNAIVGTSFTILLLIGSWQDAHFGLAAVGNAEIGVMQEYRAKQSLGRLAVLEAPARVLCDGRVQDISTADVLRDDVNTGESDPVGKDAGTKLLYGSLIVAGRGTARVVRAGAESSASKLTAVAKRFALVNSEIRIASTGFWAG